MAFQKAFNGVDRLFSDFSNFSIPIFGTLLRFRDGWDGFRSIGHAKIIPWTYYFQLWSLILKQFGEYRVCQKVGTSKPQFFPTNNAFS